MASESHGDGFFDFHFAEGALNALRLDPTGQGQFGPGLVTPGGGITPLKAAQAKGNVLMLTPESNELTWDVPFVLAGYYDADRHLNFPDTNTTAGATKLVLPVRKFVTSAGQELFIEHFKRLPAGGNPYYIFLNVRNGSQLLLVGDPTLHFDLLVTAPGVEAVTYRLGEDRISLIFKGLTGPLRLEALPAGKMEMPSANPTRPSVHFEPDFQVENRWSGKSLSASQAATDFFRMGLYWHPSVIGGGDWGQATTEYVTMHDPRSPMLRELRKKILSEMGTIGNNRFGRFGLKFAWGRYPDYGAGALLNAPENNAGWDMRMMHLCGQWIMTLGTYVTRTGDRSVLDARRGRWVALDDDTPLAAASSQDSDAVLSAGDVRLDGKPADAIFSLGQSFTTTKPFSMVKLKLLVEGNFPVSGTLTLHQLADAQKPFEGKSVYRTTFTLQPGPKPDPIAFKLPVPQPAGAYWVELIDNKSMANKYFGSGLLWITDYETNYTGGVATHGPIAGGTNYDRARALFEYIYENTGAKQENLSHHLNDPEHNIPNHRSGRTRVSTQNSFWENTGGGYDAFEGLYYNAGLASLAELADLAGKPDEAKRYRELFKLANAAYNQKYWHTVDENGRRFSRYYGVQDWDGHIWDQGYTYNNLEALSRQIGSAEQARDVLWWIDRGQWSDTGGQTWHNDIPGVWEVSLPFNTISTEAYCNVTGMLPYFEVVTNGGTRFDIAGREVWVRAQYLSIDNLHERVRQILGRSINPDKLTGGRVHDDPGGRGRWHFGPPLNERADIEGWREIFPTNGCVIPQLAFAYLRAEPTAAGLWLAPGVPSSLQKIELNGLGYGGQVLNFKATAERSAVDARELQVAAESVTFRAAAPFSRAGIGIQLTGGEPTATTQISLTLERKDGNQWQKVGENWLSRAVSGEVVYVDARQLLSADAEYRLRWHDVITTGGAQTQIVAKTSADVKLENEAIDFEVSSSYSAGPALLGLKSTEHKPLAQGASVKARLAPGQRVLLTTGI